MIDWPVQYIELTDRVDVYLLRDRKEPVYVGSIPLDPVVVPLGRSRPDRRVDPKP